MPNENHQIVWYGPETPPINRITLLRGESPTGEVVETHTPRRLSVENPPTQNQDVAITIPAESIEYPIFHYNEEEANFISNFFSSLGNQENLQIYDLTSNLSPEFTIVRDALIQLCRLRGSDEPLPLRMRFAINLLAYACVCLQYFL